MSYAPCHTNIHYLMPKLRVNTNTFSVWTSVYNNNKQQNVTNYHRFVYHLKNTQIYIDPSLFLSMPAPVRWQIGDKISIIARKLDRVHTAKGTHGCMVGMKWSGWPVHDRKLIVKTIYMVHGELMVNS